MLASYILWEESKFSRQFVSSSCYTPPLSSYLHNYVDYSVPQVGAFIDVLRKPRGSTSHLVAVHVAMHLDPSNELF